MSHSIMRFVDETQCEALIQDVNVFIDAAYTKANARARLAHIYEYGMLMDAFAFPIHCPGAPETDHLPGFAPSELPGGLADLCEAAVRVLGLERGRVLFNISRYAENGGEIPAHYDGELFDFTVTPTIGNHVRSGIRPTEVALLTLRNETADCGTHLHDDEGKVIKTNARQGELLVFDNTHYKHSVPATGANVVHPRRPDDPSPSRFVRYTVGWRALEEGFHWVDGEPLRPIDFGEAIEMHDVFLAGLWAERRAEDLSRATFPYPTRHV